MQTQTLYNPELVRISSKNLRRRHNRRGRDRDGDQGHPKPRASPKQVEIEMEDGYLPRGASHPKKFEARALDGHHRYVSF